MVATVNIIVSLKTLLHDHTAIESLAIIERMK